VEKESTAEDTLKLGADLLCDPRAGLIAKRDQDLETNEVRFSASEVDQVLDGLGRNVSTGSPRANPVPNVTEAMSDVDEVDAAASKVETASVFDCELELVCATLPVLDLEFHPFARVALGEVGMAPRHPGLQLVN
jgi:hypothetical protein